MREQLTPSVLANFVAMLRSDVEGAIAIVDDEDELPFYQKCGHADAKFWDGSGQVSEALLEIQRRGVQGVLGIVRNFEKGELRRIGALQPSVGDVCGLLLTLESADAVLRDVAGLNWTKACEREIGSIVQRVSEIAFSLSNVAMSAGRKGDDALLRELPDAYDWSGLAFDPVAIERVLGSGTASMALEAIEEAKGKSRSELLRGCDGRLALLVLARALESYRPLGLLPNGRLTGEALYAAFRIGFRREELERDSLYWDMRAWERRNLRFPLLAHWRDLDPLGVVWDQRYWELDLRYICGASEAGDALGVIKVDLDNFKQVNEALGHQVGDEAIRKFGRLAVRVMKERCDIYRRGGDEFVAIAPGLHMGLLKEMAERLRAETEREFRTWAEERGLAQAPTASVGCVAASGPVRYEAVVELLDHVQGEAKRGGKNRVVTAEV